MLPGQLKTCAKCVYALINQLICITNNECLILHHKAFSADYISRSTKIHAPSTARISSTARILVLVMYCYLLKLRCVLYFFTRCWLAHVQYIVFKFKGTHAAIEISDFKIRRTNST
jgi:hypothetical protein